MANFRAGEGARFLRGSVPVRGALLAGLLCLSPAPAQDVGNGPLKEMSLGTRGISTTFMKRREIMHGDVFSTLKPARRSKDAVEILSRYDAIWAANFLPLYNRPAWNELRRTHPNILTLWYASADSTRTPGDFGWFDYDYIHHNHPEWFIVKEKGADPRHPDNRVRWSIHTTIPSDHDRFYLDVANPDFQEWAAAWIVERVAGRRDERTPRLFDAERLRLPYHGFAADNVTLGDWRLDIISRHCPTWQYAGRFDEWNYGFCKYLATVKRALNEKHFILVANQSLKYGSNADRKYWDCLLQSVDGVMSEQPLSFLGRPYTGDSFELSLQRHEQTLRQELIDWWVVYPPADEDTGHRFFLYHYCSWLLVKKPGRSFFYATRGDPGWSNPDPPRYKEYELDIGAPQARRYRQGQCWMRDYENARILVNPMESSQRISVNGTIEELPGVSARIVMTVDAREADR